jgi:hypothetical protein
LKLTEPTIDGWLNEATSVPVGKLHNFAVLSDEPEPSKAPSGENAIAVTAFVWPLSVPTGFPLVLSQSLTVRSELPVAIRVPSVE